jgi:hypothetical protein
MTKVLVDPSIEILHIFPVFAVSLAIPPAEEVFTTEKGRLEIWIFPEPVPLFVIVKEPSKVTKRPTFV